MQTTANTTEPKIQALTWLVSQLHWEDTLGELRDGREAAPARKAA